MPVLTGHSHTRNLCILPRLIYYALVEQVQEFLPRKSKNHRGYSLLPLDAGHGGQSLQIVVLLEMIISQSFLGPF
jgi:hypothetical protein